jgi:hypothetical protein
MEKRWRRSPSPSAPAGPTLYKTFREDPMANRLLAEDQLMPELNSKLYKHPGHQEWVVFVPHREGPKRRSIPGSGD